MKIIVCIKQVVDTNDIKWTKNNTIDREGAESIVNPCDMLALETALKIKDTNPANITITAVSMGPKQAESTLKTAIAMGCDDAFLICDKKFSGSDTVATSRTLSAAIKHICPDFDLIVCGQFASDGDTAQTGPSIAQKLGIEQITYVTEPLFSPECTENDIRVIRKSDEAVEIVESPFPALICVAECPYEPRNIKINGYIRAQDYEIKTLNADDLGLSRDETGIKGSPTWVSRAFRAISQRKNELITPQNTFEALAHLTDAVFATQKNNESESNNG